MVEEKASDGQSSQIGAATVRECEELNFKDRVWMGKKSFTFLYRDHRTDGLFSNPFHIIVTISSNKTISPITKNL